MATWENTLLLGATAAGAIAVHQDLDDRMRSYTARHPERWGDAGDVVGSLGHPALQAPALLGLYGYGRWSGDEELQQLSEALASAYLINLVANTGLKVAADTDRPDDDELGGRYGFPSFHTSSSFALASVLEERYGWKAGLPAYAAAAAVAWTRIDRRDHDLSDVLFGAALGYVIGRSVARNRFRDEGPVRVRPWVHPAEGGAGIAMEASY